MRAVPMAVRRLLRRRVLAGATLLAGSAALAGCTLMPDEKRPEPLMSPRWASGPAYGRGHTPVAATTAFGDADRIGWREFFRDPQLQALIEYAIRHNLDLRQAVLNVDAQEASYRVQRADLIPKLDLSGGGQIQQYPRALSAASASSANLLGATGTGTGTGSATAVGTANGNSGGSIGSAASTVGSTGSTFRYYQLGLGVTSYELDLFGRIRSETHQAFEEYLAQVETRRASQITLVSQVAGDYFTLLADRRLLDITRQTLAAQQDTLRLTRLMLDRGTNTLLAVRQAETQVDTAKANLAQYQRQVAQDENALVLLLGAPMPDVLPPSRGIDGQDLVATLPAELPSIILARRPDVLSAEHELYAANANIGAARAAFFPQITLTGGYGTAGTGLKNLFRNDSRTWTFQPRITLPIFAAGANVANLDLAHLQKNIQIAKYQQAIQTAFRETNDSLAGLQTRDDELADQLQVTAAAADAYRLSRMRFEAGVDTYLTVLDSQRSLYSAQQSLVNAKQARLANLVTLYKALGGGWFEQSQPPSVLPPQSTTSDGVAPPAGGRG
ncbi:efflux transporter outer membrane subunit [Rhizosaccharibacter radicis]|uniref:Efflux transporter outer membrane subunit n=1 Tax=Rhizosaccharibacter radicis TaxID=2782605 RepID=A0ABT1VYU3_9PROT|nr:efflux transporter outer membrane subunit [Acetobacteraceae bacterium KSS12]